jgi:hypothetical protein
MCKGKKIEQYKYFYGKLTAQIAVYAGKIPGTLEVLQDLMGRMERNEDIVCRHCEGIIFGKKITGHKEDCAILDNYWKYFTD